MRSTKVTETPTGRYCFKKKWGGMVIHVEIREETTFPTPFSPEKEEVIVEHYWRKATEEDLVSIKIVTKK